MESKETIKLTTFNVLNEAYENPSYYHEEALPFLKWTEGRKERVIEYLKRLNSDFYCLQEVSTTAIQDIVWMGMNDHNDGNYAYLHEKRTSSPSGDDGCAIVFNTDRFGFQRQYCYRYKSGKHILLACLFGEFKTDKFFWVVCTHVDWKTREEGLAELQTVLSSDPALTDVPKIVMGDFNAVREEPWYQKLSQHGLVDALERLDVRPSGTIDNDLSRQTPYSYNSGKTSKWVDHCLLHGLKSDAVQCVMINGRENIWCTHPVLPNADVPSDHVAVTVRISLQ
jgi:endonuclease/exonuclease/phosphatase family metal-dependent hydrolase